MTTAVPVEREKPTGPRSRKGVATRARLLAAAKAVFEEDGFLEARISDIAERAGLSHGSFYHYFDSKEQIFREVAMALSDLLHAPLSTVIFDPSSTASPQDRIRAGNRRFLEDYRREARIIGVIEQVCRHDTHLDQVRFEHHQLDRERISNSIAQLQRKGWVDPSLNPTIAACALGAMVTRFAEMWLVQNHFKPDFDTGVEQLTRLFLNALHLRERPPATDFDE